MNYSSYFAIEKKLKSQGFDFTRKELIQQFTNEKKNGLKELTAFEYKEFIRWINTSFETKVVAKEELTGDESSQHQRQKIIALFRKMGYNKDNKADMQRIYSWVLKSGYLHKSLNQYTAEELPMLVWQAEKVYKDYITAK